MADRSVLKAYTKDTSPVLLITHSRTAELTNVQFFHSFLARTTSSFPSPRQHLLCSGATHSL